jgi:hypothetical protein
MVNPEGQKSHEKWWLIEDEPLVVIQTWSRMVRLIGRVR